MVLWGARYALGAICIFTALLVAQVFKYQESYVEQPKVKRVAIIGGGLSGLGAAYYLKKYGGGKFQTVLFEEQKRLGGHAQTSLLPDGSPLDQWVLVLHPVAYPNLFHLLREMNIPMRHFVLDFAFNLASHDQNTSWRTGPARTWAPGEQQAWRNAANELSRACHEAAPFTSLAEVLAELRQKHRGDPYWSTWEEMLDQAAHFFTMSPRSRASHAARVMEIFNLSGVSEWQIPKRGVEFSYVEKLASFVDVVHLNTKVRGIRREPDGGGASVFWSVNDEKEAGTEKMETFDHLVLAIPPKQIVELIVSANGTGWRKREVLLLHSIAKDSDETCAVHHSDESLFAPEHRTDPLPFVHIESHSTAPLQGDDLAGDMTVLKFTTVAVPWRPKGPYITFLRTGPSEDCEMRPCFPIQGPQEVVCHESWWETPQGIKATAELLKRYQGKGGIVYAGVWTAAARYHEAALVSGIIAAEHVGATLTFPNKCAEAVYLQQRDFHKRTDPLPDECFQMEGFSRESGRGLSCS